MSGFRLFLHPAKMYLFRFNNLVQLLERYFENYQVEKIFPGDDQFVYLHNLGLHCI